MVTRVRQLCIFVGIVVLLASCRVDTRVDITVHDNGSGVVRSSVTLDADAVGQLGGASALGANVPLGDLKSAGWTISPWVKGAAVGSQTITISHSFADQSELTRRIIDLAGPHGILQNPKISRDRGWFSSHNAVSVVVDLRSPSVDVVHDSALVTKLRSQGVDPAILQAKLAVELKSALNVSVVVHLPGGGNRTYAVAPGKLQTVRFADGGTDWDHVVKFGIGLAFALIAGFFFLAAGVGVRRNRRRARQRITRDVRPDRAPSA